jgi:hypothetical protein
MKTYVHLSVLLIMINTSNIIVEQIKTHIVCSTIFFSENPAVYKIIWEYMLEPDRPQMTV